MNRPKLRAPIDETLIARLRALQGQQALSAFARLLGVAPQTLAYAMLGSNVHSGTRALLRQRADELSAEAQGAAA